MLLFFCFFNMVLNLILGEPSKSNVWVNMLIIYIYIYIYISKRTFIDFELENVSFKY